MVPLVTRVLGAVLALVGLALTVVGVWFATQLGGAGTATFTATPSGSGPVVLGPDVLNRVDADVVVTASSNGGGRTWMALANPSDATAVLGGSSRTEVTGVSVRDWRLLTAQRGNGAPAPLATAELWRNEDDAEGRVSMTVEQADAPETVVVAAESGTVDRVTLTVSDKTWFVEAVVAALVGVFLVVVGLVLLWPRRRRPVAAPATEGRDEAPSPTEDVAAPEPVDEAAQEPVDEAAPAPTEDTTTPAPEPTTEQTPAKEATP
ncbi:MAG TPA: hypothetical protein VFL46_11650 [Phycicoccus sp.]|nr:hypothetical protein [Phycicoccus sp.]